MASTQDNHHQGVLMALNGWSIEDIIAFSVKLNMPQDVTAQMIEGYLIQRCIYKTKSVTVIQQRRYVVRLKETLMELVKNLTDKGVRFYGFDVSEDSLNPEGKTLELTKEWRIQNLFDTYREVERRTTTIDRRSDSDKRESMIKHYPSLQPNPQGRRITDVLVEVYIDLLKKKFQDFC
ncbi:hypothetical protein [Neptunomonas antarctica]|uniref:Uncharacterized protein n=1 Tax=Neptunomonas antarctica TaxID=619304 RepID=A0A1N7J5B1_9GAMM|nr:hypothetical protein [Neptunomonas antarctica]SIS44512.1 hypothetical protein SAMN05421760_101635 [Neptunomonas antarctica]